MVKMQRYPLMAAASRCAESRGFPGAAIVIDGDVDLPRQDVQHGIAPDGEAAQYAEALAERVAALPDVALRMSKQSINSCANALNHLASHMDVDQAMLCGISTEPPEGRKKFQK